MKKFLYLSSNFLRMLRVDSKPLNTKNVSRPIEVDVENTDAHEPNHCCN